MRILEQNKDFNDLGTNNKVRYALQAYNQSIHSVTKLSPDDMLFSHFSESYEEISPEIIADSYIETHKDNIYKVYEETKVFLEGNKMKCATSKVNSYKLHIKVYEQQILDS